MDLKSPTTLVAAWVLVPLLVVCVSAGLGVGLRLLSGIELRALTLPAGFLAGIAIADVLIELGASGLVTSLAVLALALAGPAWLLRRERSRLREHAEAAGAAVRGLARGAVPAPLWAGGAALGAYLVGLAPLAGSGRSGILGYVLNNDSAAHVMLVQFIAENSAEKADPVSSYTAATSAFAEGYPLGTYAWPVFSTALTGLDAFHTWSPLIAVAAAMTALIAYWLIRTLGAGRPFAAVAGAAVASGYIPLSYLAQGGAKEVLMPTTTLGAIALGVLAMERGLSVRSLIPAGLAAAAAVGNLGYSAGAWLGPAGLMLLVILVVRSVRGRNLGELRRLRAVGLFALVGVPLALPAALDSIEFFRNARFDLRDPNEVGNLLGALPLEQTLNIWLALDYRFPTPDSEAITYVGVVLAGLAAAIGLVYALAKRNVAIPVVAASAVIAAALVYPRVSIYFESKTLTVVAPALGVLSAAGVLALVSARMRALRVTGALLGVALLAGVAISALYVHWGVWNTPNDRFAEMALVNERFAGEGPLLANDREYYADYLLRDTDAWNAWSERVPLRELRTPLPPPLPHTPDFDDYLPQHFERFNLLLERKGPGGSRPPANFEPDFETARYRVWRRTGGDPLEHVAVGVGNLSGTARLRCNSSEVRGVLRRAREEGGKLVVSTRPEPFRVVPSEAWTAFSPARVGPPPPYVARDAQTGVASRTAEVERGRYRAWLQGSYGPGVRLWVGPTPHGDAINDLGLPSQWFDMGEVRVTKPETTFTLYPLERPDHHAGSRHHELASELWLEPVDASWTLETVGPDELEGYCGKPVDWVELVA